MATTRQYFIPSEFGGVWIDEQSDDPISEYYIPGMGWLAESVEAAAPAGGLFAGSLALLGAGI